MSHNRDKIRLDDLLDAIAADCWPETDAEIDAALSEPADSYSESEAASLVGRVLGDDSAGAESTHSGKDSDDATLFDHLGRVGVAPKIDVHPVVETRARREGAPIIDLYDLVAEAYIAVRNRMPVDFVVLDPSLNGWFISECRRLGALVSEFHLNRALFNVRKASRLSELPPSLRSPVITAEMDHYAHASEMALRLVQEDWFHNSHQNVALDRILCDPRLREQFDRYAAVIAGGNYGVLPLRWAALAHRKAGRSVRVDRELRVSMFDQIGKSRDIRLQRIPQTAGVYLCRSSRHDAYVGTTDNLRGRIERHLEAGPNLVPEELGFDVIRDCSIGIIEVPLSARKRNGLVWRYKNERLPLLNFVGLLPYAA